MLDKFAPYFGKFDILIYLYLYIYIYNPTYIYITTRKIHTVNEHASIGRKLYEQMFAVLNWRAVSYVTLIFHFFYQITALLESGQKFVLQTDFWPLCLMQAVALK